MENETIKSKAEGLTCYIKRDASGTQFYARAPQLTDLLEKRSRSVYGRTEPRTYPTDNGTSEIDTGGHIRPLSDLPEWALRALYSAECRDGVTVNVPENLTHAKAQERINLIVKLFSDFVRENMTAYRVSASVTLDRRIMSIEDGPR